MSEIAVYLSGVNAETFDRADEPTADADGHVISAMVLRHENASSGSMVPVRVRVGHGVAAETASSMLRKMADLIDAKPSVLSNEPGTSVRLLPDGTTAAKRVTPDTLRAFAETLPDEERERFMQMFDRIKDQLRPDDGML